jgi:hypothetical protein
VSEREEKREFPFSVDVPSPARMYDYSLGGKDNFASDREAVLAVCAQFPEAVDVPRQNRQFLFRVVRFLARDAGIRQFLDLGSGLPTQANVHEVAQRFQPDAHVVYIDNDPIVLAHGRALLEDPETTTVITADMTEPDKILADPDVRRLIDFSQPVAALMLSVGHFVAEAETLSRTMSTILDAAVPGSYLAFSQIAGENQEVVDESNEIMARRGVRWTNRTRAAVAEFARGLDLVEPGLVDVKDWRPDPFQPELVPVPEPLRPYEGASATNTTFVELGCIMRKP